MHLVLLVLNKLLPSRLSFTHIQDMKYSGAKGISDHTNSSNDSCLFKFFAYIAQTSIPGYIQLLNQIPRALLFMGTVKSKAMKMKSGMLYSPFEYSYEPPKLALEVF